MLLFDIHSAGHHLNEWKADLWNIAGIPTPEHDQESSEAILLGYLVAWFLGELVYHDRERAVICHCHEWLAGIALPLCRREELMSLQFSLLMPLCSEDICVLGPLISITT